MALIDRLLPKVIPAKTHGIIDYVHVGMNFLAGAMLFRRNRHAATGAFLLGAGVLANALLTDYPWGVFRAYSFETHRAVDYGVASVSAAMPKLIGAETGLAKMFFRMQGVGGTALAGLTDYQDRSGAKHLRGEMRFRRRTA